MGFTITGGMNFTGAGMAITAPILGDPYFNYVTLLLPGNGTNNGTNNTFLDGSTNNYTITRNGSATQGIFSPFSLVNWSNYFATTSSYLSVPIASFPYSGTTWTIEGWFYPGATSGNVGFFCSPDLLNIYYDGTTFIVDYRNNPSNPGWTKINGTISLKANTWYHVAISTNAGSMKCFINGTQYGSTVSVAAGVWGGTGSNVFEIGVSDIYTFGSPDYTLNGFVSNFRISNTALYTSNFTPSTSPLTSTANTTLLTCQSNYFKDNSTNAYTITPNSSKVSPFNPFLPSAAYVASTNQASCYLDGSSSLQWSGTTLGAGAFSLEFYIYANSFSSSFAIFGNPSNFASNQLNIRFASSTQINVDSFSVTNTAFTVPTMYANTWIHIAICRNASSQMTIFVNGVRSSTGAPTVTTNYNAGSSVSNLIGGQYSVTYYTGYITNLRYVVGSTVYDPTQTTITVPTTQPTAVANTQLLLNMSNANIIDYTGINTVITSAQISTTQSKFGGSSIYTTSSLAISGDKSMYGDFTIECWIYLTSLASNNYVYTIGNETSSRITWFVNSSGTFVYNIYGSSDVTIGGSFTTNQWYHVAIVRSGSTVTCYKNGTSIGSNTLSGTLGNANGATVLGTNNSYCNDFRITAGYARYTSNFTAPTSAFPTY